LDGLDEAMLSQRKSLRMSQNNEEKKKDEKPRTTFVREALGYSRKIAGISVELNLV
jgi:hypothetical protein